MAIQLPMTENLLHIIIQVQAAKELFMNESMMSQKGMSMSGQGYSKSRSRVDDYYSRTRNYYFAIDNQALLKEGLVKNEYCFKSILDFPINDEITNTEYSELSKFTFSY